MSSVAVTTSTDNQRSASKARERWLRSRKKGIGASDAPIVLGLSPWKTALELWAEKRGLLDDVVQESEAQRMGRRLERIVAMEYRDRHPEQRVKNPGATKLTRHPEHSFLFATLDRTIEDTNDGLGVLEIKTTGERWADQWADDAPLMYQVQLQHQMMVSGLEWGVLAVLIGGRQYVEYRYPKSTSFVANLLRAELEFWKCVVTGEEPAYQPGPDVAKALERLHPDDNGQTVVLGGEAFEIDERLLAVKQQIKTLEDEKDNLEGRIKSMIGANTFGVLPGVAMYAWKTTERSEYMVKASKFRRLTRKAYCGKHFQQL